MRRGLSGVEKLQSIMGESGVSESLKIMRLAFNPTPLAFATILATLILQSVFGGKTPRANAAYQLNPGGSPSLLYASAINGAPDVSAPASQIAAAINDALNKLNGKPWNRLSAGIVISGSNSYFIGAANDVDIYEVPFSNATDKPLAVASLGVKILLNGAVYPYAWYENSLRSAGWTDAGVGSMAQFSEGIGLALALRQFFEQEFPAMLNANRKFIAAGSAFLIDPTFSALFNSRIGIARDITNAYVGDAAISKQWIFSQVEKYNANGEQIKAEIPGAAKYTFDVYAEVIGDALAQFSADVFPTGEQPKTAPVYDIATGQEIAPDALDAEPGGVIMSTQGEPRPAALAWIAALAAAVIMGGG